MPLSHGPIRWGRDSRISQVYLGHDDRRFLRFDIGLVHTVLRVQSLPLTLRRLQLTFAGRKRTFSTRKICPARLKRTPDLALLRCRGFQLLMRRGLRAEQSFLSMKFSQGSICLRRDRSNSRFRRLDDGIGLDGA